MSEVESWLLEWIHGFLTSPPWFMPVESFIDENCLVFDGEQENKLSYTEVHERFLELIEGTIAMNLEDVGVSETQFAEACSYAMEEDESLGPLIFAEILSVDNFLTFKKMMTKRNMQLECEALKAMQAGEVEGTSAGTTGEPEDTAGEAEEDKELLLALRLSRELSLGEGTMSKMDDDEMSKAMKASVVQSQLSQKDYDREQAELEHAIALSLAHEEQRVTQMEQAKEVIPPTPPPAQPKEEKKKEKEVAVALKKATLAPRKKKTLSSLPPLPKIRKNLSANKEAANTLFAKNQQALVTRKKEEKVLLKEKAQVTDNMMERRAAFLRAQRDIIVARKKAERAAKLRAFQKDVAVKTEEKKEPAPAPAAAAAAPSPEDVKVAEKQAQRMAMRQTLAARFKKDMTTRTQNLGRQATLGDNIKKAEEMRVKKAADSKKEQTAFLAEEKDRQTKMAEFHRNLTASHGIDSSDF